MKYIIKQAETLLQSSRPGIGFSEDEWRAIIARWQEAAAERVGPFKPFMPLVCRVKGHRWWIRSFKDNVIEGGRIRRDAISYERSHCDCCGAPNPAYDPKSS